MKKNHCHLQYSIPGALMGESMGEKMENNLRHYVKARHADAQKLYIL